MYSYENEIVVICNNYSILHLDLSLSRMICLPRVVIADLPETLRRFTNQLVSQSAVDTHLSFRRPLSRQLHSNIEHLLRLGDGIHHPILQGFRSSPSMRFEEHLPSHLWMELQTWKCANARKVQTKVHWRHGEETAFAVHHSVVVAKRERAGTAESMACDEGDCWEGEVDDGCQKWEEAF